MPLRLERIAAARREARAYVLDIAPDLFGGMVLVRRWGRIGTPLRMRLDLYRDESDAWSALHRQLRRRLRRGYRVMEGRR